MVAIFQEHAEVVSGFNKPARASRLLKPFFVSLLVRFVPLHINVCSATFFFKAECFVSSCKKKNLPLSQDGLNGL